MNEHLYFSVKVYCPVYSPVYCLVKVASFSLVKTLMIKTMIKHDILPLLSGCVYLQYLVLLALVDLAGQAAVGQGVLDDVLVGLGAGLLVQLRPCVTSRGRRVVMTTCSGISMAMERGRRGNPRMPG